MLKAEKNNPMLPSAERNFLPGICAILLIAFALRMAYAHFSLNIYFPDELYQYLEQAHRKVFGYGLIPWETRFNARSPILALAVTPILAITKYLGIDDPAIYVNLVNLFFVVCSLSLVFAIYVIAKKVAGESVARLAALLSALWYEFICLAHKPLASICSAYCILFSMALVIEYRNRAGVFFAALLLGIGLYIRVQYAPLILVLALYHLYTLDGKLRIAYLAGILAAIIFDGLADWWFWGQPFISFVNYFLIQFLLDIASHFGKTPYYYYIISLCVSSVLIFPALASWSVFRCRPNLLLIVCVGLVLLPHMLVPHKEHRFIIAAIPFLIVMSARAIMDITNLLFKNRSMKTTAVYLAILIVAAVSAVGLFNKIPGQWRASNVPHQFVDNRIKAYLWLHDHDSPVAVYYLGQKTYFSASYYFLHRKVPLFIADKDRNLNKIARGSAEEKEKLCRMVSHVITGKDRKMAPCFKLQKTFGHVAIFKSVYENDQIVPPGFDESLGTASFEAGLDRKDFARINFALLWKALMRKIKAD